VCTFLYFSDSRRHSFSIQIPLEKQHVPGYPEFPITVGEHIRKKRMDLGLLQKEVSEIIGVTESSIWNWEHGAEAGLQYNPNLYFALFKREYWLFFGGQFFQGSIRVPIMLA